MKEEVAAAVVFLTRCLRWNKALENGKLESFSNQLTSVLFEKFKNHWYENDPTKGQAYRCLKVTECTSSDPVLAKAAQQSGLLPHEVIFPLEMTLWIDPADVTLRVGESTNGRCYTIVQKEENGLIENKAASLDIEEIVKSEDIRKTNERISMLEQAKRRRHRRNSSAVNGGKSNGGNNAKKYSFYNPNLAMAAATSSPSKKASNSSALQAGGSSMPWYTSHPYAQPVVMQQ